MPSSKTEILLVEDDQVLAYMLTDFLQKKSCKVTHCPNVELAWNKFMKNKYDICLLDIMLPGKKNGITLMKYIREKNSAVPVMLLSSNIMEEEIIYYFKQGIDGYLIKPYNFDELLLRIKVFLKRSKKVDDAMPYQFKLGALNFDYYTLRLKNHRLEYQLTQREAELLRYLCINANRVVRREDILMDLWGKNDHFLGRSLDVFIGKLRKYLKSQESINIQTIPRVGFKLNDNLLKQDGQISGLLINTA